MSDSFKDSQKNRGADEPKATGLSGKMSHLIRKVTRKRAAAPSPARQRPKAKEDGDGCLVIGVLLAAVLVWLAWNKFFL
jgi:hypothetical protein